MEALLRRIREFHPKRSIITEDLAKRTAGHKGEVSLSFHLSSLDHKKICILHNVRLKVNDFVFQIDFMLVSTNYILILEVKNIAGTIYFESNFDQFIRTINGKEEGFYNPLIQVRRQENLLKEWLNVNKLPSIPIESFIVFTNPQTIIKADNKFRDSKKIIHSYNLTNRIDFLQKIHRNQLLTEKELAKLTRLIKKKNEPEEVNILARYGIKKEEILKGVQCPKCSYLPLKRKGKWSCESCRCLFQDAHINAIHDYLHLLQPTISYHQFKDFLQIESRSVASKLLSSLGLPYTGSTKNRVYYLNKDSISLNQKTKQPL
ncbi:hypothetical protein JOC95_002383 [Bacillus tianshenii]|uniref:NERD domain-containing protein n=1 Tax=Sutcliffiella tianshenii TaxID=1463404 RepID=A0ABS2P0P7_9BACI|nr:nuclease-related domain-containing protein [Bacillus tianshenii]MBM7620530.1 hypothetical protein [Bacillus tianshenii]